jgi:hypothetical protein
MMPESAGWRLNIAFVYLWFRSPEAMCILYITFIEGVEKKTMK